MKNLENYINNSKENSSFNFIKDIELQEVLYLFSGYIFFIYFEEIINKNISEELKEIKAHTIFIYLGSIIEAVVYYHIQTKLIDEKSKRKYLEIEVFKKIQKVKETLNLYICKLEKKKLILIVL